MPNYVVMISPVFAAFEVTQLLVAQRYIGLEQIRRNAHPLEAVASPSGVLAVAWMLGLLCSYVYQVALLFQPELGVKVAAVLLLLVSATGFAIRRVCGLRWGLVVLTPECGARAGFYVFVFNMMVIHGNNHLYGLEWLYNRF